MFQNQDCDTLSNMTAVYIHYSKSQD